MTNNAESRRPVTPILLGAFFVFATAMALLAGITLLIPGSPLDVAWRIKRSEHAQLMAMGSWVGWAFLVLATTAGLASYGSFSRRPWGWRLALAILCVNGAGDAIRAAGGAWLEGLVGVGVVIVIVWWLTRPQVRALFEQ
jgi:hypothetical protein